MGSQFDEIAKAVARGVNRRRALRAMLGGVAGAVVATMMAGSKTPTAEAGVPEAPSPSVMAEPTWNQGRAGWNQSGAQLNEVHLNQARSDQRPAYWNQKGPKLNEARFNQARFNQARLNAIRSKFNQGRPGWNQRQRVLNQGQPGAGGEPLRINQPRITFNASGNGPSLNMVHGPSSEPTRRP